MTPLATPRRIRRHRKLAVAFAVVTATTIGTADALVSAPFSQPGSASFTPPAEPPAASNGGNPLRLPDARDVLPAELFDAPTVSDPAIPLPVDMAPWTPAPDRPSDGPPPAGAQDPSALELPGPADGTEPASTADGLAIVPTAIVPSPPAPPAQPIPPPRLDGVLTGPKPQLPVPALVPTGPVPAAPECSPPANGALDPGSDPSLRCDDDGPLGIGLPAPAAQVTVPVVSEAITTPPAPRPVTTLTEALR